MRQRRIRRVFNFLTGEEAVLFIKNAAIVCVAMVTLAWVCLFSIADRVRKSDTFEQGVCVNNIDLYGMSYSEAISSVVHDTEKYLDAISFTLLANGTEYTLNAADFITADVELVVKRAFSVGKSDSVFDETEHIHDLYTTYSLNAKKLRSLLENIAVETDVAAIEPKAVFDTDLRTFKFFDGANGKKLDVDTSCQAVIDKINVGDNSPLELVYDDVLPTYTLDDVKNNTKLISEFTSITTNNYNRNVNINLMCQYVDGYEITPGSVLSINELVGERTVEKGFLAAPAIMDGKRTVDDIGGGICQLSGTLYNAALLANMQVVERQPHSWPSDYLEIGLDSTLDWATNKDLKIRNVSEYSMHIVAWLENSNFSGKNVLHVAIYGQPFPEGITVKLRSEIVETIAPAERVVTYTYSLAAGVSQTVVQERTGYRTRAWREFYLNGELIDAEIVNTSYYAPIQGEVRVGKASGGNSGNVGDEPQETASPSPEPTIPPPQTDPVSDFGEN